METSSPPPPAIDLPTHLYYQLVYTLTGLLPPPLDNTPEALRTRNLAAIAKVAALLPVNANEADLAAQCIAARAQAEELLRLLRQNAGDIGLVMRLNAQYGSMVRTSLSVHGRLMRVQAQRQNREKIEGAATEDARAQHVAERFMLKVVAPGAKPQQAARPAPPPVEAPAPCADQTAKETVPENGTNSHDTAFETWWSEQPCSHQSSKPDLRKVLREATAASPLPGQESPEQSRKPQKGSPTPVMPTKVGTHVFINLNKDMDGAPSRTMTM